MNEDQCAAQTPPSTLAWRIKRFVTVPVGNFVRMLFLRFAYRHLMRLSHYFGWHYAPIRPGPDGDGYRWCRWCGMRGRTYEGPLKHLNDISSRS